LTTREGPVFVDDELYDLSGTKIKVTSRAINSENIKTGDHSYPPQALSWNPPKPKTFTINGVKLPAPDMDDKNCETYRIVLGGWAKHEDMVRIDNVLSKLLSGEQS
jgi:hypothetical protein